MKLKKLTVLAILSTMFVVGCDGTSSSIDNSSENPSSENQSSEQVNIKDKYDCITIANALEIASKSTEVTEQRYYIYGKINSISSYIYGSMEIEDETGKISAFGTYSADGSLRYEALDYKPVIGDEVVLYANLHNYNGTSEIKSGWIVDYKKNDVTFDTTDYENMSIANARETEKGAKVIVSGVVAKITYANGMKPNGFYLIDKTSSIYIFDSTMAPLVSVGNTVTIAGTKDYWILDTEVSNATKYGYNGACQLTKINILNNDNQVSDFDTSWMLETTIKDLMETSVSENITNKVYKVNALIKKVEGTGFTNYYIDDIDGKTGSYSYTQCNGKDYEWLNEFDGKICTVFVTPINAKSSPSGCVWRFVPIKVIDENYTFDTANVGDYIYTYHLANLFKSLYTGDPVLEVPETMSSELLKFENATISYSSNNEECVYFEKQDDKLIMHTKDEGTADITININYQNNPTFTKQVSISVASPEIDNAITVKEAIEADVDSTVIVKGIAGPSLVNKVGFYLIDETGAIAITTSADTLKLISLGNEIILEGTRAQMGSAENVKGETCILDCTLKANLYGNHSYSTASFDNSKTLLDLSQIPVSEDATSQIYVINATFQKVETANYSNFYIVDGETKILLYTSSGNQYNWLSDYIGVTVSVEFALCNWNKKTSYRGCVLSITNSNNEKIFNTLNYKK